MKKSSKSTINKKFYNKNKQYFKDYYKRNKKKQLRASAQWKKNNPDKHRSHTYKSVYGITLEQYNSLLRLQKSKCAICKIAAKDLKKKLCVDHNHKTNKIRGLLCDGCNVSLGRFKDDKKLLSRAIAYLDKYD